MQDDFHNRIRAGDREAYLELMQTYGKLLWLIVGSVLRGVGTAQDMEECVSDVFISLWENPRGFDPRRGTIKTYLAVLARSKALDRYRKLAKAQRGLSPAGVAQAAEAPSAYPSAYPLAYPSAQQSPSANDPDAAPAPATGPTHADLSDALVDRENRAALYAAIGALREPDREILIRRYFLDEKPLEIARSTGRPVKEIENRLYQGKGKLRRLLTLEGGVL